MLLILLIEVAVEKTNKMWKKYREGKVAGEQVWRVYDRRGRQERIQRYKG